MPPEQIQYPTMTQLFLADPVFLIGILVPILIAGGIVWFRIRAYRRITTRVDRTAEHNNAQWLEAAARSERVIVLLTEIRDQLARMTAPGGSPK